MAAAVVIWLVTGSTFALLFAGLGPVTAVASWVDGRVANRRTRRRETLRFAEQLEGARSQIARGHAIERLALEEVTPSASDIVERHGSDPYRWSVGVGSPINVSVGRGAIASTLALETIVAGPDSRFTDDLHSLTTDAEVLDQAPIVVDARLGIGVCGSPVVAHAVARAIAAQLAWSMSPDEHWWAGAKDEQSWLCELPHPRRTRASTGSVYEFGRNDATTASVVVAIAASPDRLPGACRVVLAVGPTGALLIRHPEAARRGVIQPDVVSREHCTRWARRIHRDAAADGLISRHTGVPDTAELGPLLRSNSEKGRRSLACEPAISAAGPVSLDLVADGPHAVIGGTTGSGKSELLIAWVIAMAAPRSPAEVTFLLVDFKGGSAFAELARLPHTVGIITDLDNAGAKRALESLRAEVRFRERTLVDEGVRSIEETAACPRLVIVVDEFAAMLADHPDLHALFADLAARGRSLGIHLVLCTQRPAGVVRDSVLANADLRVSLRVNNRADSSAVVGTDAAAAIPQAARGRAIVSRSGASEELVQFALAGSGDIDRVAERWAGQPRPRRPWREPLPCVVLPSDLPDAVDGYVFALSDLPDEQRWGAAVYRPEVDVNVLVLGSSGCGKSSALAAIARAAVSKAAVANASVTPASVTPASVTRATDAVVWIPRECDAAWDVVCDLAATLELRGGGDPHAATLVLLDDVDSLLSRFGGDHRAAFAELLGRVLRDGPSRGIRTVLSAQRVTAESQSIVAGVPGRLLMGHSSRHDFVLAGGDGTQYLPDLQPGAAVWRGHRIQIAVVEAATRTEGIAREVELAPGRPLAIVTARAATLLSRYPDSIALSDSVGDLTLVTTPGAIVIGDVEQWQSRWGAIAALRAHAEILFDECSAAEFRALTRSRHLPPPISAGMCWRFNDDGTASRVRLPR